MKKNSIGILFLDGFIMLSCAAVFVIGFDLSLGPLKKGKVADALITAVNQVKLEKVTAIFDEAAYTEFTGKPRPASLQEYRHQRANRTDDYGRTPLMWLAYVNYSMDASGHSILDSVCAGLGMKMEEKAPDFSLLAMADDKRVAIVPVLLEAGAEVNAKDNDGWTALMWASWSGLPKVTEKLIEHKADVKVMDRKGNSALTLAAMRGNTGIVEMLLANGAVVSEKDKAETKRALAEYPRRKAKYDEILKLITP